MQLPRRRKERTGLRRLTKGLVLTALLLFLAGAYFAARNWESRIAVSQFEKECVQIEQTVEEAFRLSLSELEVLEAFVSIKGDITREDFRRLSKPVLRHEPHVAAIGWVSRVKREERTQWEREATRGEGRTIAIKDHGTLQPSAGQAEYYPLQFVEPRESSGHSIGFDTNSDPNRRIAISAAIRQMRPVSTSLTSLAPGSAAISGAVVIRPVQKNGKPVGAFTMKIRPDLLLSAATRPFGLAGLTVVLRDVETGKVLTRQQRSKEAPSALRRAVTWRFAERDWEMETVAHRDFLAARRSYLPEVGFGVGVTLVFAMSAYVAMMHRHIVGARKRTRRQNRALRKLNTELREEVMERRQAETRLAEYSQQLEQTTLLAESSARAKSDFLAMVSHEIRTPMHAIIGMTNILLDSPLNPDQRESAGIVLRSADSLLQIINDILDFSKIEAGKFEVEAVPFDLQQTLSEVMDAVSVRAGQKGISLMVGYPHDAPTRFLGDGGAVRQILLNLTGNAVKFTEQGQIAVDVLVLEEDEETARMYISVTDTGVGIPDDRLPRLFHPFQQADSSMRRKFGGTGLGLVISKRLTELLGGTISVDSELHVGTIFQLDIPMRKDQSIPSGNYCPLELRNVAVLIAEPNASISAILSKQLEGCHVRHHAVQTTADLLAALRSAQTEYRMFLIGGDQTDSWDPVEITHLIRQYSRSERPVLVRIAPYATAGERAAMEEAGFSAYLVMPVFAAVLMNAVGQAWDAACQGMLPKPILTRQSLREDRANISMAEPLSHLCRVLLVEDNAVNQRIGMRLLEKLNCTVDIAANGLAAIRQWSAQHYDVVLMDCQMPEMDGFEATAEIRNRESSAGEGRHTTIIAMTANNMQGDREQCLASGMDDFLPKPVSFAELRGKLEQVAQQRNSPESYTA